MAGMLDDMGLGFDVSPEEQARMRAMALRDKTGWMGSQPGSLADNLFGGGPAQPNTPPNMQPNTPPNMGPQPPQPMPQGAVRPVQPPQAAQSAPPVQQQQQPAPPVQQQQQPRGLPRAVAAAQTTSTSADSKPVTPPPSDEVTPVQSGLDTLRQRRGELEGKLDAYDQPVDYSGLKGEMQRRQGDSRDSMIMALAAQNAGKGFESFTKHYEDQAAKQGANMQVEGGYINAQGDAVIDPAYKHQQQIAMYNKQLDATNRAIATAESQAEARALAAHRDKINEELRRAQMAQSLLIAQGNQALRQQGIEATAARKTDSQNQGNWRVEDRLRGDLNRITKDYTDTRDSTQKLLALPTGRLSNVEQQALVIGFNKVLDPSSVVREGEYDRMAKGMGLYQRMENFKDQIMRGSVITPAMAAQIRATVTQYNQIAEKAIQNKADEFHRIAQQRGLDPRAIIDQRYMPKEPPAGAVRPAGPSALPQAAAAAKGGTAPIRVP